MYDEPLFLPAGDKALVVELGDTIDPDTNRSVHNLLQAIQRQSLEGIIDLVPTYRSLLVLYDPMRLALTELKSRLESINESLDEIDVQKPRIIHIPTLYGGEYGPDLGAVAEHTGLTAEEVISIHSGNDYLVYMMGFTPGFPYLGGLSKKVATPRLATPRLEIPAGSVGIAEDQTGVYPVASPGGWRLIGRTPLWLFDPRNDPPALLTAGDYVKFVPMTGDDEYQDIRGQVESRDYVVATETKS